VTVWLLPVVEVDGVDGAVERAVDGVAEGLVGRAVGGPVGGATKWLVIGLIVSDFLGSTGSGFAVDIAAEDDSILVASRVVVDLEAGVLRVVVLVESVIGVGLITVGAGVDSMAG
jgi:hypothetical protein